MKVKLGKTVLTLLVLCLLLGILPTAAFATSSSTPVEMAAAEPAESALYYDEGADTAAAGTANSAAVVEPTDSSTVDDSALANVSDDALLNEEDAEAVVDDSANNTTVAEPADGLTVEESAIREVNDEASLNERSVDLATAVDDIYLTTSAPPHVAFTSVSILGFTMAVLTDNNTGMPVYCLDHDREYPLGGTAVIPIDPLEIYDFETYEGLQALLLNGYPHNTGGLSNNVAHAYTQLAVWFWLGEKGFPGLNYEYFEGYTMTTRERTYMASLMEAARTPSFPLFELYATNIIMGQEGDVFIGTSTITFNNLLGNYSIDSTKLPNGVTVTGYTGNSGDVLVFIAPLSYKGQSLNLEDFLVGLDSRTFLNLSFFDNIYLSEQRIVRVVIGDTAVIFAMIKIEFPDDPEPFDPIFSDPDPDDPTPEIPEPFDPTPDEPTILKVAAETPKTGDSSSAAFYLLLLGGSLIAIGIVIMVSKQRKKA